MSVQFDMFAGADGEQPVRLRSDPASKRLPAPEIDEASMVAHLASTGRYRILEKLQPRPVAARPQFPYRSVILDTETTGLDYRRHEIIELTALPTTWSPGR